MFKGLKFETGTEIGRISADFAIGYSEIASTEKEKKVIRRPFPWIILLLVLIAFISVWMFRHGIFISPPRFNSILLSINHEPQKVLSGEKIFLHPEDKIKILDISTNILFNLHVRLVAKDLDVTALQYEEIKLADLLPDHEMFAHYCFRIKVKYRNRFMGKIDLDCRPYTEDWIDRADKIIDKDKRLVFLERARHFLPEEPEITKRLIIEYKSHKSWKKAAFMLEDLAAKKPDQEILYDLLDVYRAMKSRDSVIAVLKRLSNLNPNDLELHFQLAEAFENNGQFTEAIQEYKGLLKKMNKEDSLSVYKHLGYIYTESGQFKKAISFYLKAEKLDHEDMNLYYNLSYLFEKINKSESADKYLEKAVRLKSEDVESRLKLSQNLIKKGRLEEAQKYLREILSRKPDSTNALSLMAHLLHKKGDVKELKKVYKKILALEPENKTVMYNLGILEYEGGNQKASLKYFNGYLKLHPKDASVHEILFDIYQKQKNIQMAFNEAIILVELRPEDLGAYRLIFNYLYVRCKYEKIISIMKKGLKANPGQTKLRKYLLSAYLKKGKDEEAIKQIKELLKTDPKNIDLLFQLARLQEQRARPEKAVDIYKKIIQLSPANEKAKDAYLSLRLKGVKDKDGK
ncbi:MAG: hypothetical protein B1H11_09015 [Desulfobacteraceae bacterium 4484_190.1]|nr:MAG: hypothetical protein B1H11_09015 [Desulfobacteraceae bacterium 4484_190.1]